MALSKRQKEIQKQFDKAKFYPIQEAIELLKKLPAVKFIQSLDVSVQLGVDPKKSDQVVRGSVVLPNGTGKSVRVAVFTQGPNVEAATAAGADRVGMQDLLEDFQSGNIDVDVVIASPDAMGTVGRLGAILGTKGLMPNPKVGTVTPDVATAVKNAKSGQVRFRTDKSGIIHASIGKLDFDVAKLVENIEALIVSLKKLKPQTSKGVYLKKLVLSSTMGPGVAVLPSSVETWQK